MGKKKQSAHKEKKVDEIAYLAEEDESLERVNLSKKNKLKEKLKQCQKEKEEYLTQLQRTRADFINYRKRQEKDKEAMSTIQTAIVLREFLRVFDSLEKGAESNKEIEQIKKQFENLLRLYEVEKIETKEKKFDYRVHEAVGQADSDREEGIIIKEVQSGYMLKKRVLRPSKVIVAK